MAVNNELLGLAGATFRVSKRSFDLASAGVELTLEQDEPRYYAAVASAAQAAPGVQPDTSYRVTAPTGLALTNPGPGKIGIHIDASPDLRVTNGGALLIQVRPADGGTWVSMPSAPGTTTDQTINVLQKGVYIVQVDWRSSSGQQSGQWAAGAVTVAETAFATQSDVSNAVSDLAKGDNPVFSGVLGIPVYALDALPPVNGDNKRKSIVVIDSAGRPAVCVSNGSNWISQITGAAVA